MADAEYTKARGVDWARLLAELVAAEPGGTLTVGRLAARLGIKRPTLNQYRLEGEAEPPHRTGERMVEAWMRATGRPREAVPMRVIVVRGRR